MTWKDTVSVRTSLTDTLTMRGSFNSLYYLWGKSTLNIHWKDWGWNWSSNTLATWCKELTHRKRPWCWERLRAGGEGPRKGEMVGWHPWLNGCEFEQTPGVSEGQGSWCAAVHGIAKSQIQLSNWATLNYEMVTLALRGASDSFHLPLSLSREDYTQHSCSRNAHVVVAHLSCSGMMCTCFLRS